MRVQKCYRWYCVISWSFWIITILLAFLSGGPYEVHNLDFYHFVVKLSVVSFTSVLIPVHPVLFVWSLISSIKHKHEADIVFNVCSILVTTILAFFVIAYHAWLVGA